MLDFQLMPGHLIRRMHQISQSVFTELTTRAGFDLTSVQYAAMKTIEAHPGIDQATLASLIAYDRATIAGVVSRLERKQLISRVISAQDRRARELTLTLVGEKVLVEIEPIVATAQRKMLAKLDDHERQQLLFLLSKATTLSESLDQETLAEAEVPHRANG